MWPQTSIPASSDLKVEWKITAAHKTQNWAYYITKPDLELDPSQPLTKDDFQEEPILLLDTDHDAPPSTVSHTIPAKGLAQHSGYAVIYGVWSIGDTGNAFYNCLDVNIENDEAAEPPTETTSTSTTAAPTTSASATSTAALTGTAVSGTAVSGTAAATGACPHQREQPALATTPGQTRLYFNFLVAKSVVLSIPESFLLFLRVFCTLTFPFSCLLSLQRIPLHLSHLLELDLFLILLWSQAYCGPQKEFIKKRGSRSAHSATFDNTIHKSTISFTSALFLGLAQLFITQTFRNFYNYLLNRSSRSQAL